MQVSMQFEKFITESFSNLTFANLSYLVANAAQYLSDWIEKPRTYTLITQLVGVTFLCMICHIHVLIPPLLLTIACIAQYQGEKHQESIALLQERNKELQEQKTLCQNITKALGTHENSSRELSREVTELKTVTTALCTILQDLKSLCPEEGSRVSFSLPDTTWLISPEIAENYLSLRKMDETALQALFTLWTQIHQNGEQTLALVRQLHGHTFQDTA